VGKDLAARDVVRHIVDRVHLRAREPEPPREHARLVVVLALRYLLRLQHL
jgi:hypothetical protein